MTLRFIGTTSDDGDCPTLYEISETEEILVQGDRETEPEHLAQLRDVKPSETFVRVPRALLTRYAPRTATPPLQPFSAISRMFRDFRHTAFRLETRRGYASDRNSPKWQRWLDGEDIRNLSRAGAERLHLPDSKTVARFAFDDEDTTLGVYVTDDPVEVLAACQARDAAWHHATPTSDYAKQVRSSE
ncbi:DUF6879 family protein [Streptomyces sp. NPDC005435]|uniref:DUF6879 family protein n=1 Tax=Streptomyces sp. NPDC005435 TaxID=3154464 RepID=UPI0034514C28